MYRCLVTYIELMCAGPTAASEVEVVARFLPHLPPQPRGMAATATPHHRSEYNLRDVLWKDVLWKDVLWKDVL
jgi:N-acetyl-gamma-glutamylphosphate reductase